MQELTFEQAEEVNGGAIVNPVTVMIAVRIIKVATPYVKRGVAAVGVAIAGTMGASDGGDAAK